MFKFTAVTLAGNTTLAYHSEEEVLRMYEETCEAHGSRPAISTKRIDVPNSFILMIALGWQGGTIHQVAQETGLTVQEILDLHKVQRQESKLDGITDYELGYHYKHIKTDKEVIKDKLQYWRGVAECIIMYRRPFILERLQ